MCVHTETGRDCYDCLSYATPDPYVKHLYQKRTHKRRGLNLDSDHFESDHADTADKYLGGTLVALHAVPVYNNPSPTRKKLRIVKKGGKVGEIFSWTVNKANGDVWWQLENPKGYVLSVEGSFDKELLEKSLALNQAKRQAEIDEKVKARLAANKNPLYTGGKDLLNFDFLGDLKWILIIVLVLAIAGAIYKIAA
jgi:hypothetical protein